MPEIRPSSELRNRFTEIEKYVKKTGEPVFITSRGRSSMVVLSHEKYEELTGEKAVLDVSVLSDAEKKQFGRVIKNLRVCKGMSIMDVKFETGISVEMLQKIECGDETPDASQIRVMADAFDVKPETLMYFCEPQPGKSGKFRNDLVLLLNKIAGKVADEMDE